MITMEKIDYVMNITGASYEVVRVALLDADGDVDKAIKIIMHSVSIPEEKENEKKDFINFDEIKNAIKEIWDKGNASKIIVSKDDEIVLSLPLTVSALGLVLAPIAALIGAGVVLVTDYDFKIVMDSGEVIDLKEYINIKKFSKKSKEENQEENENNSDNKKDEE